MILLISSFYVLSLFLFFRNNNKSNKIFLLLAIFLTLIMSVLMGTRDFSVGTDTKVYVDAFNNIFKEDQRWEIFFNFISHIIKLIYDNPHFYIFCISFLFSFNIFIGIYLYVDKKDYSGILIVLLMYYSMFSIYDLHSNVLRQGIGLSFLLIAIGLYKKDHRIIALLFILMAMGSHNSVIMPSIVFFVTNKFKNININKMLAFLVSILGVYVLFGLDIFSIFSDSLIELIKPYKSDYSVLTKIFFALSIYNTIEEGSLTLLNFTGKSIIMMSLFIPIYLYIFLSNNKNNHIFIIYVILSIIYFIFAYQGYSYRFYYSAIFLAPILYYNIINNLKITKINKKTIILIAGFISLVHYVLFVFLSKYHTLGVL